VKEIVTDFTTAHKQNVSPNTPLTTRLYNKPKLHYISTRANDATTISATTTTMSTQHRKKATGRSHETEPETTSKCTWQTIKKNRKRSCPTTENRPQQLEFNCNNRYEQLSQLPDADNDDIMLTFHLHFIFIPSSLNQIFKLLIFSLS
jgi:hypothetical protein